MNQLVRTVGVSLTVALGAGCAVGYGLGTTTHSASASSDPRSGIAEDGEITFSSAYQEFRIIDTTGIVLAALVNAGRQYNARADAIAQAEYKAPNQDGTVTVEYSYEPMPILAGLLTDLRIRIPLGSPTIEIPSGTEQMRETEYWGFEIRPEFYTFRPIKTLPMVSSLWLNVEAEMWKAPQPSDVDAELTEIDMSFGASTSYVVRQNITATGRIGIGLLSPLFAALGGGSKFNPSGELEVGWRPWHSDKFGVQISGVAYAGREHATERSVFATRLGLNAAVTFGNQIPKKARKTQTTPEAATPNAALSGNICLGAAAPAECNVVNTLPDDPKLLYVACAQATVNAANTSDFSTQPKTCRTAGAGIANWLAINGSTVDAATQKNLRIAAATMFDFAGAGYEVTSGKLTADHCATIEATYNHVIGDGTPTLPTKVQAANAAVSQCRAQYTCSADPQQGMVCTSKSAPAP